MSKWRQAATETMFGVLMEQQALGVTDKAIVAKAIDAAYPFGPREHWPYKQWLAARKSFFTLYQLPRKQSKKEADLLALIEPMLPRNQS